MAVHTVPCEICDRVAMCASGSQSGLIAELDTGWAVLGPLQFWPGYSLLLCKHPVTELHELESDVRARHLEELSQLALAVYRAVQPHKLNYALLGNAVPHIHWHIYPRRADEPQPRLPVWSQQPTRDVAAAYVLDPQRHEGLRRRIAEELVAIRQVRRA